LLIPGLLALLALARLRSLTRLLSRLLSLLLAALLIAGLLVTRLLTPCLLACLVAAGLLLLTRLATASSTGQLPLRESLHLLTQAFDLIDRLLRLLALIPALVPCGGSLLGIFQIVPELIQSLCDRRLTHHGVLPHALPDVLFRGLHAAFDLILLGVARCVAQLLRDIRLDTAHGAGSLLELLQQLGIIFT
jgi:hypothetical protein